jgi:predicted ABC-type ATPase
MSEGHEKPVCLIIAGPNGAGKTTFGDKIFVGTRLDPDAIARTASPGNPAAASLLASREVLIAIQDHLEQRRSFTQETTLSSMQPLRTMERAREAGFSIGLIYIGLASALESARRVAERVAKGGHDIPMADIVRRFDRSLENLERAIVKADMVQIVANDWYDYRPIRGFEHGRIVHRTLDVPAYLEKAVRVLEARFDDAALDPPVDD